MKIQALCFINNIHLLQQHAIAKLIKIPARHLMCQTPNATWNIVRSNDWFLYPLHRTTDRDTPPRDIKSPMRCQRFWQLCRSHHDEWRAREVIDVIVNLSCRAHCGRFARRRPYWRGREREPIGSSKVRSLSSWNWDESDSHLDLLKLSCTLQIFYASKSRCIILRLSISIDYFSINSYPTFTQTNSICLLDFA